MRIINLAWNPGGKSHSSTKILDIYWLTQVVWTFNESVMIDAN